MPEQIKERVNSASHTLPNPDGPNLHRAGGQGRFQLPAPWAGSQKLNLPSSCTTSYQLSELGSRCDKRTRKGEDEQVLTLTSSSAAAAASSQLYCTLLTHSQQNDRELRVPSLSAMTTGFSSMLRCDLRNQSPWHQALPQILRWEVSLCSFCLEVRRFLRSRFAMQLYLICNFSSGTVLSTFLLHCRECFLQWTLLL